MQFSTRARYGLRICFLLGLAQDDCTSLSTIVKQTNLSEKYLEQLLSKLKKGGIVTALRGKSGGYALSRDTNNITLNEILIALDDGFTVTDCASGTCSDEYCPNKKVFQRLYADVNKILDNFTLKEMIDEYKCV